jgi:hypothetical protein
MRSTLVSLPLSSIFANRASLVVAVAVSVSTPVKRAVDSNSNLEASFETRDGHTAKDLVVRTMFEVYIVG